MKPPSSFKAFSFISSSNLVHMVCLTPSASATLGRILSVHLPPNEGSRPLGCMLQRVPGWLLYLAVFGEEAGIRVPRSSSVYTQKEQAAAQ